MFFDELSSLFEVLVAQPHPVVVVDGDFNIHIKYISDSDTRCSFRELLASSGPNETHPRSNSPSRRYTLDLLLTFLQCRVDRVVVDTADIISDDSLVTCHLLLRVNFSFVADRPTDPWLASGANRGTILRFIQDNPVRRPAPEGSNFDDFFDIFEATMRGLSDRVARLHLVRRRVGRLVAWFDNEWRTLRLHHRTI